MTIGEKIRTLRQEKGLTQEMLADKTGISARSIQRIENGEVTARADSLHKIAIALEIPYEDFLIDESESPEEHKWSVILHLSGLFLIVVPSLIIYTLKKDDFPAIKTQAVEVINFQLNLMMIMIPCGLLAFLMVPIPILVLSAIIGTIIILINTVKVVMNVGYKYPLFITFIKTL
ncbi:MAG: DUF4870 domain-containing protein [Bacteroidota bacterium]